MNEISKQGYQSIHKNLNVTSSKMLSFIHQKIYTQFPSDHQITVLKQINNRQLKQYSLNKKIKQQQNDIKDIFVKSDRKEILKANKNSKNILGQSHSQNQTFAFERQWIPCSQGKSSRKLVSADTSHHFYRKSIQRKKKQDKTPAEIIINTSFSTVEVPKSTIFSERSIHEVPVFQKLTSDLINLNLSKAIRYRQSNKQEKVRKHKKNSQKINVQNFEHRKYDFQQKVKGWQIMIEQDADFS